MGALSRDLRYGLRMLRSNPGLTIVAMMALALGIGANSAIFSVVDAVVLRPLPFESPERLVHVVKARERGGSGAASFPDYMDWREQARVFTRTAAYRTESLPLLDGTESERIDGVVTNHELLSLLGIRVPLGRDFQPGEDEPGRAPVALLSDSLWRRRYGADPSIIGRTVRLDDGSYTVVGVLPRDFRFPLDGPPAELFVTSPYGSVDRELREVRGSHYLTVLARLRPGVTLEQAQSEMNTIHSRLAQQYPAENGSAVVNVYSLHEELVKNVRPTLLLVFGAVGFVLLIACVNIANLLLTRAAVRQREIAIRAAVGATRMQVVRQLLVESALLSLGGALVGLALATWGVDVLVSFLPPDMPRLNAVSINWRVTAMTLVLSLATGVLFGIVPALHATRLNLYDALKDAGSRLTGSFGQRRLLNAFTVVEIAFAVILLVGAGLMLRSFLRLSDVDPGFTARGLLTAGMQLPDSRYHEEADVRRFAAQLSTRLAGMPGVESSALVMPMPFSRNNVVLGLDIEGSPAAPGEQRMTSYRGVTTDYFSTMRIPLRAGRVFTAADDERAPPVVIINEFFARKYFASVDPVGRRLNLGLGPEPVYREVVGVVGNVRHHSLDKEAGAEVYTPFAQTPWSEFHVVVRGAAPMNLAGGLRAEVRAIDSGLALSQVTTMEELLDNSLGKPRTGMVLLALFAAVALVLAMVGVYGVIAYSVSQRRHELSIRVALGASDTDILRLVVGHGFRLALWGVLLGGTSAVMMSRLLEGLIYGVARTDPLTYVGLNLLIIAVSTLASYIPARVAAKAEPVAALRSA